VETTDLNSIVTPAVVIDRHQLEKNIAVMQALADRHGVALRPHIKTHKSPVIAAMQLEAGAVGLACATIDEAEAMAVAGWRDIAIANQVVGAAKIERLVSLAQKADISCAVDSSHHITEIASAAAASGATVAVMLDVDSGLHRCGVADIEALRALAKLVRHEEGVRLQGIMTHGGHAYGAAPENIAAVGTAEGQLMAEFAERLRAEGFDIPTVSVGSTPTSKTAVAVDGVTELRAGNYVFYDMIQVALGSATLEQCSLTVLATVISTPSATRAVVDAGSKALTNDGGAHGRDNLKGYGYLPDKDVWLTRLSEEHGVIEHDGKPFQVGERVRIIPNHACPVMNLVGTAYLHADQGLTPIETVGRR